MRRIEDDPQADDYDEPLPGSALDEPTGNHATAGEPGEDDWDPEAEDDEDLDADYDDLGDDLEPDGIDDAPPAAPAPPPPRHEPPAVREEPMGAPPEVGAYLPMLAEPSTLGPRQARRANQRRQRRATIFALLSASGVLLVIALLLPVLTRDQGQTSAAATSDEPQAAQADPTVAAGPLVTRTVLLVGYGEEGGPARSTTLLTASSDGSAGSVVFLPPGLLLEIPRFGLDRLSQAQRFEGSDLVAETLESALGVTIDDYAALSEAGLASLLDRVGEFSVFVGDEALVGREEEGVSPVRIEAGQQELGGEQMALYFDLLAEGESPVDAFPRQQQVFTALLAQIADNPEVLDRVFTEGATEFDGAGDPDALRDVLEGLAAAQANEQLTYEVLPVEPFGGPTEGTVTTYRTEADTADFLDSLLPESGSG